MLKLSQLLTYGDDGVAADPSRAEGLINQAIAAGAKSWGFFSLAVFYRADTPLKDAAKAAAAYEKSIAEGNTLAMERLALMLATGDGVPADPTRAEMLLTKAIDAGDIRGGAYTRGVVYDSDTPLKDPAKAVAAFEQSAGAGNTDAMRALASKLIKGEGVAVDLPRAEGLLNQAIAAGDVAQAAYALGDLYRADTPLKDEEKAIAAYEQAAKAGNGAADLMLAQINSASPGDVASLRQMAGHFAKAAAVLGDEVTLNAMFGLPVASVVAMVQQSLDDRGGASLRPDGVHSTRTAAAIANYCSKNKISDCNPRFLTRSFVTALILR